MWGNVRSDLHVTMYMQFNNVMIIIIKIYSRQNYQQIANSSLFITDMLDTGRKLICSNASMKMYTCSGVYKQIQPVKIKQNLAPQDFRPETIDNSLITCRLLRPIHLSIASMIFCQHTPHALIPLEQIPIHGNSGTCM